MAQQPAVVFIARHGPRLDVADSNWHSTTPTPYDPPLTFGGWKQSQQLGIRIASLLYAREQSLSNTATTTEPPTPEGVKSQDFAASHDAQQDGASRKRKRRKHKVVIHSSPFLRCVQTSVAIAAGIAQFTPPTQNATSKSAGPSRTRTPNNLSSMTPRSSVSDHTSTSGLLAIPGPRHAFAQEVTRRVTYGTRNKRAKLRVDAFLGEWLNPEYFEHITPPPPSPLMVATAKAELMQNDTIDIFTPTITHKSSNNSLWGGGSTGTRPQSRDSALEDWDDVIDALPPPSPRRDRTSSYSSIASSDSTSSRRNRLSYGQGPHSFLRTETTAYLPPTPSYAVSTAERIPKGYFAHAKNHCTNIDSHWDSSRPPQDWGDGGEYGEEWSLLHRRFRRGLTQMIFWYSQHNADDRGEDALGLDQAEHHDDDDAEEQEDLVVILVTHGAGCNALIGALTGQPVLIDVGMASLTMAVRKDDSPATADIRAQDGTYTNGERQRQASLDIGLTSMYEMKIVASNEHLRPGWDPLRTLMPLGPRTIDPMQRLRPVRGDSMPSTMNGLAEQAGHGSMSTALGSIRRPHSSNQVPSVTSAPATNGLTTPELRDGLSTPDSGVTTPTSWSGGLWTPPSARTPQLMAHYIRDERRELFSSLNEGVSKKLEPHAKPETGSLAPVKAPVVQIVAHEKSSTDGPSDDETDAVAQLRSQLSNKPPNALARGLSQRKLWGNRPSGEMPVRNMTPKRRWTVTEDQ